MSHNSYAVVPTSPGELTSSFDRENPYTPLHPPSQREKIFARILTALSLLAVVIAVTNAAVLQIRQKPPSHALSMTRPNPYIGLEHLQRNQSSPSWPLSSINYPDVLRTKSANGALATAKDDVVFFDSEHTLLMQYRVKDFKLEHCALAFVVPDLDLVSTSQKHWEGNAQGLSITARYIDLDPDNTGKLLSYDKAMPSRSITGYSVADISLQNSNTTQSSSFRCQTGSVVTLELSLRCEGVSEGNCRLAFTQNLSSPPMGVRVIQSEASF